MATNRFLYEVLVRGTPDGKVEAAHQIWAIAYIDDKTGEVIAVKHEPAKVLSIDDVSSIVGEQFVGTVQQIDDLTKQVDAAKEMVEAQRSELHARDTKIRQMERAEAEPVKAG